MKCFRIDESGYTGFDLLNPDQPFQGATSVAISNEDARHLIQEHFPNSKASELKYRALVRRPKNHPRLLGLQSDILANYDCVTYVCDKRFLLLLMFLDYAVEPFYYERGLDFYADGQNYSLASLLYFVGPTLLGKEAFEGMQSAFQFAVKEKTRSALCDLVLAVRETKWRELPEALGPLARYSAPECLSAIASPGVSTDAAFMVLQALISRMEAMTDEPYRIEHDQSRNLLTYHALLKRYINHVDQIEFRQSEISRIKFPLKLASVTQIDSKASPAVQLADVMIGAAVEAAGKLTGRLTGGLDPEAVIEQYADDQIIHMFPSIDFDEQKHFRRGTQAAEIIDYFSRFGG